MGGRWWRETARSVGNERVRRLVGLKMRLVAAKEAGIRGVEG